MITPVPRSISVRNFFTQTLSFVIFLSALVLVATPVQALDKPKDKVILTITGAVGNTNDGKTATFSMQMLEKLPQQKVFTKSLWYPDGAEFTGPLLRDVLAAAGAKGSKITAEALNDYKTEIPFADAVEIDVILATKMNGKPMPVREKGPLFVIYPFDAKPALNTPTYHNRSAWQLVRMAVQ
jgi:hypothetical protein